MADDTKIPETKQEIMNQPTTGLPMSLEDMAGDVQAGGKVSMRDLSIPYLYILQGLSPQVQPASPKFIRGAGVSMLYMTVANQVFPGEEGITIVPCYFERVANEWVPRNKGGGLVATHDPESGIIQQGKALDPNKPGELFLPNGNLIVETAYHYILVKRGERYTETVFPLKSTALKHSRNWNSNINDLLIPGTQTHIPRWLYEWQLTSGPETRADKIWYSPFFKQGAMVSAEVYQQAKQYAKIAATGQLRRPMEEAEQEGGAVSSGAEGDGSPI